MADPMIRLILGVKLRMMRNFLRNFQKRWLINVALALLLAFIIFGGGFSFFYWVFQALFQTQFQPYGAMLALRLLRLSFMAFFYMLVFSNIVSVLATVFFSRETEFLMSLPVSHASVFWARFIESLVYSSWALVAMSFPLLFSFGMRKGMLGEDSVTPSWFYALAPLLFAVFAAIPALLGAGGIVIVTSWVPARRARMLLFGMLLVVVFMAWPMVSRVVQTVQDFPPVPQEQDVRALLDAMRATTPAFSPHRWLSEAIACLASRGREMDAALWSGLLVATAVLLVRLMGHLVPLIYYRAWALCGQRGGRRRDRSWSFMDGLKPFLFPFKSSVRALVMKDFKTFWRNPGQWVQLIILFGLMMIYVANLKNMPIGIDNPFWKNILSFFNMVATCLVASTMTTRFAYPMLSLEGRQCWVVGLAPVKSTQLVWQKYWLCWVACAAAIGLVTVISSETIVLELDMKLICYTTALLVTFGLSSIAVGIGALMPEFAEDNAANIANNLGGTITIVISMAYVALTGASEAFAVDLFMVRSMISKRVFLEILLGILAANLAVIILPMGLALRKWKKIEF